MKNTTQTQTITVLEKQITEKSNKTLYLVLRQKGFADEIIEKINKEVEKRLESILNKKIHKLENMHFDNSEESLECFLLKQVIKILDDMQKEKLLNISEEDKKIIFDILNNKDEKNKEKDQ